jgi:hypothetical protein
VLCGWNARSCQHIKRLWSTIEQKKIPALASKPNIIKRGKIMGASTLPAEFRGLEAFSEWALEHRAERFNKRVNSSMEKITAFFL